MSELSFLIELLLNHEFPKETKVLIAERIKEVEKTLTTRTPILATNQIQNVPPKLQQAPSTIALMAKHGDIPWANPPITLTQEASPVVLSAGDIQARNASMEILKKNKNPPMTTR